MKTRAQEIMDLQIRFRRLEAEKKHKTANMVLARLRDLMTRQIKVENRQDRRKAT